jgi:branched-chain amino acid transport system ATP-binding protein
MTEALLQVSGLTHRFGGLAAVDGVSFSVHRGSIHALIGPNGAGKSTLVNLLSGELAPDGGSIRLRGGEIAGLPAHRVSALGVGRSYQKTNIFPQFSAFENCRLAAQSRRPHPFALFRDALSFAEVSAQADRVLDMAGLAARAGAPAQGLSHGEQRQLEIAMALAIAPEVLLLDEPLAGMGAEESSRMVELLSGLRADHAILLVEHDMDAVFALADTLTVMVNGRVLESGPPAQIRASAAVQDAYLGSEAVGV